MQTERRIIEDLLASFPAEDCALLDRLADHPGGVDAASVDKDAAERLRRRLPKLVRLDSDRGRLRFDAPDIAHVMRKALDRATVAPADASERRDSLPLAIARAQAEGDFTTALSLLKHGGGVFFMHFHGMEACWTALDGFPKAMQRQEEPLVLGFAMHALKAGSVSRARHLLTQRFGDDVNDLKRVLDAPGLFSLDLRLFRFLMSMYEDIAITDAMRAQLFDALGEVPLDDHLQRGSFYNAMLEVFVRRRDLNAAAEIAARARHHYNQANAYLLGFYIDIYQSILCLMRGASNEAHTHMLAARETIAKVAFESASDNRILGLVEAIIRYERGETEPLIRFVNEEFDQFAYGEIWPTVAEFAINYGGQALSRHVAVAAARAFLDKWHIQQWRSNRFRLVITLREVAILQDGNRWQEAADLLTAIQSRVNRTWVEAAVDNLIRLVDASEIALVLAWLRHLLWAVPTRPLLRDQLAELIQNDRLTGRQRITIHLWSAHLARIQRDLSVARAEFLQALEACSRLGTIMPLVEEAAICERLLKDKRISSFVLAKGGVRQTIRRVRAFGAGTADRGKNAGLTRQEAKILSLIVEGGSNKAVARQLGLAEVTVKFHLSNLYRKLGCQGRAEAIASAHALGWTD